MTRLNASIIASGSKNFVIAPRRDDPDSLTLSAARRRPHRRQWPLLLLAMATLLTVLPGCQGRFPSERIPKTRWLIMPFVQPPAMATTPKAIKGWWLGATTIRQNPRAGAMIADTLANAMSDLDYVNLFSPIELKFYFAGKREKLQTAFPGLSETEIDNRLAQVSPIEYARELGADKVLTGRIVRHYLAENRTIHWWWSVLEVDVALTDVLTGKVEWTGNYKVRTQLASQASLQEDMARRLIEDLKEQYFLPQTR